MAKPMKIQSIIFDKDKHSLDAAKKWLSDHGYKAEVDEKESTYRFRQREPGPMERFRTIDLTTGIKAVIGKDGLPGGEKYDPSQFDQEQLAIGTKHELEHTTDESIARQIAMDHLAENPDYYQQVSPAYRLKTILDELFKIFNISKTQPTSAEVHVPVAGGKKKVHKSGTRRVSTVAVKLGTKLLMGRRRDNEKWTVPGGHCDDGETMLQGAIRELKEETGIEIKEDQIKAITDISKRQGVHGGALHVQGFLTEMDERPATTMKQDPDGEVYRWQWVDVKDGLPDDIAGQLHVPADRNILLQALGLAEQMEDALEDLYELQDMVSGTDYEMSNGLNEEDARKKAVKNLENDKMHYRRKLDPDNLDALYGMNIDLGSGQKREPYYIGFDLYPYDHGTAVHDLHMGIPLPDKTVKSVRAVNSINHMDGLKNDPKALLKEISRVLLPGGEFIYEGPQDLYANTGMTDALPELVKIDGEDNCGESNETIYRQHFIKVVKPDAATSNTAESLVGNPKYDKHPSDLLLAMRALEYTYPQLSSTDKISKSMNEVIVPIMKSDKKKQIVYGVVLSPNEVDEQGDWMTEEDIEMAAHHYMVDARAIGKEHESKINAVPVESYIAPQDIMFEGGPYGPQLVKKGSWILGVLIKDKKEWEKVEEGDYTGFSVGGFGARKKGA